MSYFPAHFTGWWNPLIAGWSSALWRGIAAITGRHRRWRVDLPAPSQNPAVCAICRVGQLACHRTGDGRATRCALSSGSAPGRQAITTAGALFVTRLKRNVCRRQVQPNPIRDPAILADQTLRVGHKKPRGGADNPLYDTELREIVIAREDREPLHLVTNDRQRSAAEIAELYKERRQIELFFKWIKQNLKIKSFLGRSENAVKVQIDIALIAFCLLRLFQHSHAASHKGGANALLARLKIALLDPLDLTNRPIAQPKPPPLRPPSPQLALLPAITA